MTREHDGEGFPERYGRWAVIAGGSDGIGAAFAAEAARRGLDVAVVGRREDVLEAKAAELADTHGVDTRAIRADLTSAEGLERVARGTAELDVGLFVYNAGSSTVSSKLLDLPVEEHLAMLHRNCGGPLVLGHHFGARLRARGRGGLVLMSSVAALGGSSYQALYCATKAFDTILAEGLWHELAPEGVDVVGVLAGPTRTETMLRTGERFEDAMDPAEVATGALDHLGRGPTFVPGEANQAAVRGMWPVPRVPLVNGMSQACADLFDLPFTPVEGREFHGG